MDTKLDTPDNFPGKTCKLYFYFYAWRLEA